jgi:hypothetical protein
LLRISKPKPIVSKPKLTKTKTSKPKPYQNQNYQNQNQTKTKTLGFGSFGFGACLFRVELNGFIVGFCMYDVVICVECFCEKKVDFLRG